MTEEKPSTASPQPAQLTQEQSNLILQLYEAGAVKFGKFTLKSGVQSPVYIDLRVTVSHPKLLASVATELEKTAAEVSYDILCGVPYTALPFATAMSLANGKPMVMRRKEAKSYGTKKVIEGHVEKGKTCLVVEDLVTSGMSVMETVDPLQAEGLEVKHVVVLLDREQGARANLKEKGLELHSVFKISDMLDVLVKAKFVQPEVRDELTAFLKDNQVKPSMPDVVNGAKKAEENGSNCHLTYAARADKVQCAVGKRLLELMESKKTNLAVAADVTTKAQLFELAEAVGPEICMLKTHADIISDWDSGTGQALMEIAKRHHFMIFEDRKFADIGNTVLHQVTGGVHNIARWADIINAHSVPGPGIVSGLEKALHGEKPQTGNGTGLVLLAEMSSEGNLAASLPQYKEKTVEMAEKSREFVFGFISMGRVAGDEFVYMTPGVKMAQGSDGLGQQYATPERVIGEKGSDVMIVGRGIYEAENPAKEAKSYRQAGWRAYEKRSSGLQ